MFRKKYMLPVVLTFILSVFYVLFFYNQYRSIVQHERDIAQQKIISVTSELTTLIHQGISSGAYVYSTPPILGILNAQNNNGYDTKESTSYEQWLSRLSRIFKGVVDNDLYIRQIRYIETTGAGIELLKIQRDKGGAAYDNPILQSKKESSYYKKILNLKNQNFYITVPEWNKEFGHIEVPKWLTMRIIYPVLDGDVVKYALITNLDFSRILETISKNKSLDFSMFYNGSLLFSNIKGGDSIRYVNKKYTVPESSINLNVKVEYREGKVFDEVFILLLITVLLYVFSLSIILMLYFYFQTIVTKLNRVNVINGRYKALVENSSDILMLFDRQGEIVEANPSALFYLDLSNNKLFDAILLEGGVSQERIFEEVDHDVFSRIEFHSTVNNNIYLGAVNKFFLFNEKENVEYYLLAAHDITEQRENEKKIYTYNIRLEQQVDERTKALVLANQDAQKANAAKSKFLANVSHEIRTPLNGVSGMLTLLNESEMTNNQRQYLKMASTSVHTLSILINDLLDLSKIESGVIELEDEEYDVIEQVDSVIYSFSVQANERQLHLIYESDGFAQFPIYGDSLRCKQIVTNLIGNALKFTSSGSVLTRISFNLDLNQVSIAVTDTGIGISKDSIDKIFTPFKQADSSTTRKFGGTGLGLSVSRELCVLMGGSLTCKSELGKGATFTATFDMGDRNKLMPIEFPTFLDKKKVVVNHSDELVCSVLEQYVRHFGGEPMSCSDWQTLDEKLTSAAELADLTVLEYDVKQNKDRVDGPCLFLVNDRSAPFVLKDGNVLCEPITPFSFQQALCSLLGLDDKKEDLKSYKMKGQFSDDIAKTDIPFVIVDDNRVNIVVASGLLSSIANNIVTATNGEEALERVREVGEKGQVPIVLMDCQMPIMDGFEATQSIRRGLAGENVKGAIIIALTAGAMESDRQACFDAGMDSFISKPLDANKFRDKMRKYIDIYQSKFVN